MSLDDDEIKHLTKVFRAQVGDKFLLTDGRGRLFQAELTQLERKFHEVKLLEVLRIEPKPTAKEVLIGFLKGKDLEEVVDTCAQVKPTKIQVLWTEHTQESESKSHEKLFQRLRIKAITGLKQSKSLWLTEIPESIQFDQAIIESTANKGVETDNQPIDLVLDMDGAPALSGEAQSQIRESGVRLWFGPEGGLSQTEIHQILELPRAQSLNLGDFRLRAITAPIFTLGYLQGNLSK